MPIYKIKLIDRQEIAKEMVVFTFEKPTGFSFIPGQYGGFTLINPSETDANGITRRFSFLNAPHDDHLRIATRIQQSAYKRVLNTLPLGSEIKLAGPTGNFILHEDENTPAVMIAGGIGITPFYSMIKHAIHVGSKRELYLFYGNQSHHCAPFLSELTELAKKHKTLKLIPTFEKPDTDWQGETGYITQTMIKKYLPNLSIPIFYICGSPAMVSTLQESLMEMDIDAERIRVEDFPGY